MIQAQNAVLRSDTRGELLAHAVSPSALWVTTAPETDVRIVFEAGKCSLNEHEVHRLERWIKQWYTPASKCRLYLGGAEVTSRSNRLRRLGFLMALLEQFGVPQHRVQTDSEWLKPTRMGSIDDLPADAIWMRINGFQPECPLQSEGLKR